VYDDQNYLISLNAIGGYAVILQRKTVTWNYSLWWGACNQKVDFINIMAENVLISGLTDEKSNVRLPWHRNGWWACDERVMKDITSCKYCWSIIGVSYALYAGQRRKFLKLLMTQKHKSINPEPWRILYRLRASRLREKTLLC